MCWKSVFIGVTSALNCVVSHLSVFTQVLLNKPEELGGFYSQWKYRMVE